MAKKNRLFEQIKWHLEVGAHLRHFKNRIVTCVAFGKPSNNPRHVGTVRFAKHLK